MLQKTVTADFLEKTRKPNNGEAAQYYVEGSHEAIIDPEIWAQVQLEFARRKEFGTSYSGKSNISGKLICGDCGELYGRKVWHSTDKYRKEVWRCNGKYKTDKECVCRTPALTTEEIQSKFIRAYNQQMLDMPRVLRDCEQVVDLLSDNSDTDLLISEKEQEQEILGRMIDELIHKNATVPIPQNEYAAEYDRLKQRHDTLTSEIEQLQEQQVQREQKRKAIRGFVNKLKKSPEVLTEWDPSIWAALTEKAIAYRDGSITFTFYNGNAVTIKADEY